MAILRPFCAIRPAKEYAASIAALPYDVYDRVRAKAAVNRNPLSFLRVDRAETQLSEETDMYCTAVYEKARDTLSDMLSGGLFIREKKPCHYLYSLTMCGHTQDGLVGCASIDDYQDGSIKRHENTLPAKELDRIHHIDTLSAQTGPIFLACRPHVQLRDLLTARKQFPALYDFTSEDGIRHQVWKIEGDTEIEQIARFMSEISTLYIADGHHRAASAVNVGLMRRKAHPAYDGTEEFNYFLSVLFMADELRIFPYNRLVAGAWRDSPSALLSKLADDFCVEPWPDSSDRSGGEVPHDGTPWQEPPVRIGGASPLDGTPWQEPPVRIGREIPLGGTPWQGQAHAPAQKGEIAMYLDRSWYRLHVRPSLLCGDPVKDLDVSILQDHVLEPFFSIHDPKTDPRLSFVGGIQSVASVTEMADARPGSVVFSMYPTSMEELLAVADAGGLMPPKSTWFEPKLRSGLFIHEIEA